MEKLCPRCGETKPLTDEYFYRARPRKNHPKESWQSFCKACWKSINAINKARRKANAGNKVQYPGWKTTPILFLHEGSEGIVCIVPKDFVSVPSEQAPALEDEVSTIFRDSEE